MSRQLGTLLRYVDFVPVLNTPTIIIAVHYLYGKLTLQHSVFITHRLTWEVTIA